MNGHRYTTHELIVSHEPGQLGEATCAEISERLEAVFTEAQGVARA